MEIEEQIHEDNQIRKEKNFRLVTEAPTHELVAELLKREGVWSQKIIPCEHYRVYVRGSIREQGIGEATVIVVRKTE